MKSKHRVQKHGEVFTPQWVVDKMIAIPGIKERTEDVFATFLEPSAGEGAFLLAIEDMKLKFVTDTYSGDSWSTYALWALSGIYGIEYLEDNLEAARQNMLGAFCGLLRGCMWCSLYPSVQIYISQPEPSSGRMSCREIPLPTRIIQESRLSLAFGSLSRSFRERYSASPFRIRQFRG
jgi:hypothetical protein